MIQDLDIISKDSIKNFIKNNKNSHNQIFTRVCRERDLETAQWLFKKYPNIKLSYNLEEPFRIACYYGKINLAKWLLKTKPDINIYADNNCAFIWSCSRGPSCCLIENASIFY